MDWSPGGRRRQGVEMLISGVKCYQNPTKHLPLLVLLDELSRVAKKRTCASRPPPTSPLHLCENVFLRAPNNVTCPQMYAPWLLSSSPHGCVKSFSFSPPNLYTRNTKRKKDPPPITYLVWYFRPDKMFWLTSDLVDTFFIAFKLVEYFSWVFSGKEKALLTRSCLDQQMDLFGGEGWLRLGGPCLGERFSFQDRTPQRVDYIGRPASVMIVAFYKFGCIL